MSDGKWAYIDDIIYLLVYIIWHHLCFTLYIETYDDSSNKENVPPNKNKDDIFDFEQSSFKYDDEYSTDESYKYSSEEDEEYFSDRSETSHEDVNKDANIENDNSKYHIIIIF